MIKKKKCIFIGDSHIDIEASKKNNIDFLLHLTSENKDKFDLNHIFYFE